MKKSDTASAFYSAIAIGIAVATLSQSNLGHAGKSGQVKCYGVSKKGQNDCAIKSQGTHCAGTAKSDNISDAWNWSTVTECEKRGGSLTVSKPRIDSPDKS